jgi:hypothetical protein
MGYRGITEEEYEELKQEWRAEAEADAYTEDEDEDYYY